ncbi:programmed cell death protein 2-like [Saccostrea echinata]|uniref:programmed cell death protein 2-like n=1 Tax=Saccostrea echinata TaxID=191078 RepID=UPI002A809AEF|nr:programmed cell death protein 2-like [Saccostrea echinata]
MALLGLKDELLEGSNSSWNVNKIGGLPDWMCAECIIPKCQCCNDPMILIVQIYCPLDGFPYHRTLYVFTCKRKQCWGHDESWCVLRSQSLDTNYKKLSSKSSKQVKEEAMFASEDDWGDDVNDLNDFSLSKSCNKMEQNTKSNSRKSDYVDVVKCEASGKNNHNTELPEVAITEGALSNEFKGLTVQDDEDITDEEDYVNGEDKMVIPDDSFQNVLELIENKQMTSNDMEEGNESVTDRLVSYYLSVLEEAHLQTEIDNNHLKKLLSQYQRNEGVDLEGLLYQDLPSTTSSNGKAGAATQGEKYERTEIKHGDKMFHRFLKQTSICPQQCVRYQWNGSPLYIKEMSPSEKTAITNRSCPSCGGPVVFELQLMPALVNFLQLPENSGPATEFGTVIVFTCKNSCWDGQSKTIQEFVHVQPDPDHHLFN